MSPFGTAPDGEILGTKGTEDNHLMGKEGPRSGEWPAATSHGIRNRGDTMLASQILGGRRLKMPAAPSVLQPPSGCRTVGYYPKHGSACGRACGGQGRLVGTVAGNISLREWSAARLVACVMQLRSASLCGSDYVSTVFPAAPWHERASAAHLRLRDSPHGRLYLLSFTPEPGLRTVSAPF